MTTDTRALVERGRRLQLSSRRDHQKDAEWREEAIATLAQQAERIAVLEQGREWMPVNEYRPYVHGFRVDIWAEGQRYPDATYTISKACWFDHKSNFIPDPEYFMALPQPPLQALLSPEAEQEGGE